jgi:hypothetical protein
MLPPQTVQVFSGIAITLFYFLVVLMFGMGLWKVVVPHRGGHGDINSLYSIEAGWLSFIFGQGVLAFVWLVVALGKSFTAEMVWAISGLALGFGLLAMRKDVVQTIKLVWEAARRGWCSLLTWSWYACAALLICGIGVMQGIAAIVPTENHDALQWYLASALTIATTHGLELQPFLAPHNGLYPLQIEMHWAAVFVMGNETAVLIWDYLCAMSFLCGVGILSRKASQSPRAALVAMLVVLSTAGFFYSVGRGKTDNAASQYGIAACLSLLLSPALGTRSLLLVGGFLGWSIASRYTNVILLPAVILAAYWLGKTQPDGLPTRTDARCMGAGMALHLLWIGVGCSMAWAPMLIKNLILVGCPFAPLIGCRGTFWAGAFDVLKQQMANISGSDFIFYPFIWTFAWRKYMLGGLSPLYIGLIPLLFDRTIWNRLELRVRLLGTMGLVSFGTWLFIEPNILYTRWLLIPLALIAIPLGAATVEALEPRSYGGQWAKGLMISGLLLMCLWLSFESRSVVYGIRYAIGRDHRDTIYADQRGYDSARWLNENVDVGTRIALAGWSSYSLFLRNEHFSHAENVAEYQWLWQHQLSDLKWSRINLSRMILESWTLDIWKFYLIHGFSYVVVDNSYVVQAEKAWGQLMPRTPLPVAFVGKHHTIVKISERERWQVQPQEAEAFGM